MTDPFLPEQGTAEPRPDGGETFGEEGRELELTVERDRGRHPDPDGDGAVDVGAPPGTETPYRPPTGGSVDPALEAEEPLRPSDA